ncbi:MAG: hypothetical protein FJ285_06390 [Planctomycetes bacterium]|nr:hypothetical protein [Planctomycetota bacterium]
MEGGRDEGRRAEGAVVLGGLASFSAAESASAGGLGGDGGIDGARGGEGGAVGARGGEGGTDGARPIPVAGDGDAGRPDAGVPRGVPIGGRELGAPNGR